MNSLDNMKHMLSLMESSHSVQEAAPLAVAAGGAVARMAAKKGAGQMVMNEACGDMPMQQPETEDRTSITYSKTHNQGDASATVSATAKNLEELEAVLRLAGVDPDLAKVHHAEPEPVAEPEPQPAVTFGTAGDYSYSTDAEFIRDQLRQRMQDYL